MSKCSYLQIEHQNVNRVVLVGAASVILKVNSTDSSQKLFRSTSGGEVNSLPTLHQKLRQKFITILIINDCVSMEYFSLTNLYSIFNQGRMG